MGLVQPVYRLMPCGVDKEILCVCNYEFSPYWGTKNHIKFVSKSEYGADIKIYTSIDLSIMKPRFFVHIIDSSINRFDILRFEFDAFQIANNGNAWIGSYLLDMPNDLLIDLRHRICFAEEKFQEMQVTNALSQLVG